MTKHISLFFSLVLLTWYLNNYAIAEFSSPDLKATIVRSGLSRNFQEPSLNTKDELSFNPGNSTITFWVKINVLKPEEFIIQRTEWYSPDGRMWLEESHGISNAVYSKRKDAMPEGGLVSSSIDTNQIPSNLEGAWCVRAYFNHTLVTEKYFMYGSEKNPPSESQILNAKEKIKKNEELSSLFDIKPSDHFSSYLSLDSEGYLEKQRIVRPDIAFTPDDTIVYTFNADKLNMPGWCPTLRLFMISPDGKKYKNFDHTVYISPESNRIARAQQKINLKNLSGEKELYGLWKIDFFYLDTGVSVDRKYFYISENKIDQINPADIKDLDDKIGDDGVFDKYLDFFEKNMAANGRKEREVVVKKMNEDNSMVKEVMNLATIIKGTDKERILKENGAPQTIIRNKSGNELWIYWQEDEWSKSKSAAGSIHRSRMATSGSNVGAGIAGAIAGAVVEGLVNVPTGKLKKVYFTRDAVEEVITIPNVRITDIK